MKLLNIFIVNIGDIMKPLNAFGKFVKMPV